MYCNVVHVFMLVGVSTESILTFIWLHVWHHIEGRQPKNEAIAVLYMNPNTYTWLW